MMSQEIHFEHKNANYRIIGTKAEYATQEIVRQRRIIEEYSRSNSLFSVSFNPLHLDTNAPPIIRRMLIGAFLTTTGPMAAVAGCIAEFAARAVYQNTDDDIIVDNGGDIFIISSKRIVSALYAGEGSPFNNLAYCIEPSQTPLAICSSSATMGHSQSLGKADLATAFSADAALADCAATMGANLVNSVEDIEQSAEQMAAVPGVTGAIVIKDDKIALAGFPPRLIHHHDHAIHTKVTHNPGSNFRTTFFS